MTLQNLIRLQCADSSSFLKLAAEMNFMTVAKPYGLLAWHDGTQYGEWLTEGPTGPLTNPSGWVMVSAKVMERHQLRLLAGTMMEWSETSGDHHMQASKAITKLLDERDHAWAELREIRLLVGAREDEATVDEVQTAMVQMARLAELVEHQ